VRARVERDFNVLFKAPSLMGALGDKDLVESIRDTVLALEETSASLPSALQAIRVSSPRLFFLSDDNLLELLNVTYHDIRATERFMTSIFSWFSSLIIVDGTELRVTRRVSADLVDI
jgi:hypothetical protein